MFSTEEVIRYFDRLAPDWDSSIIRNDAVISAILDNAGVTEGKDILDVACGTGVLIPDYLERKVSSVTAIDISPRMIEIARTKFPQPNVSVLCGDVEKMKAERQFDCVVVYNAFPHFPDPERLVRHLAAMLKPGGMLTVAHGMSREKINAHHGGSAHSISNGLMPAEELAAIFEKYLTVTTLISDERMYQVVGNYPLPSIH